MLIKICGITSVEDGQLALDLGANALGFNFYPPSPRYLSPSRAVDLIDQLQGNYLRVGIFVGPSIDWTLPLDAFQLHGFNDPGDIPPHQGRRVIVATDVRRWRGFPHHEIILDDSWGSGRNSDLRLLQSIDRPFILAGGLNHSNIRSAIDLLQPAGVDICSGVEHSPGRKDPERLRRLFSQLSEFV